MAAAVAAISMLFYESFLIHARIAFSGFGLERVSFKTMECLTNARFSCLQTNPLRAPSANAACRLAASVSLFLRGIGRLTKTIGSQLCNVGVSKASLPNNASIFDAIAPLSVDGSLEARSSPIATPILRAIVILSLFSRCSCESADERMTMSSAAMSTEEWCFGGVGISGRELLP